VPDRLLHHSTVVSIQGEDYRLKDKRRAGLREYPFLPDEGTRRYRRGDRVIFASYCCICS
jgi:hypothetical protein